MEKTIAERLREIENMGGCDAMRVVRAFGWERPPCVSSGDTCTECSIKILLRLADAIEAELNTSKSRELPDGIEWPRFEDGELVKFGDEFEHDGLNDTVEQFTFREAGFWAHGNGDPSWEVYSWGEPVKRPEPEVLDADGVPIEVGDTVWYVDHAGEVVEHTVERFGKNGFHPGTMVFFENRNWMPPNELTHRKPDTQEAIDDDATVPAAVYCVRHGLVESDTDVDDATLLELHILDLLARQRKLLGGE